MRLIFDASSEIGAAIRRLSAKRGVSADEVVRQAVGSELFIDCVHRDGGSVLVVDRLGRVRALLPR